MRLVHRTVLCVLCLACIGAVIADGCGGFETHRTKVSGSVAEVAGNRHTQQGPLRAVKWGVGQKARLSLQIGAFVPYCEGIKPKPRIEHVTRNWRRHGLVLTMLVRFPLRQASNCVGYGLAVVRWVKLGRKAKGTAIYDGSRHPPALRVRGL